MSRTTFDVAEIFNIPATPRAPGDGRSLLAVVVFVALMVTGVAILDQVVQVPVLSIAYDAPAG